MKTNDKLRALIDAFTDLADNTGCSERGTMESLLDVFEPEELVEVCLHTLAHEKDLAGRRVLVPAGPTQEALDRLAAHGMTVHRTDLEGNVTLRME